MDGITYSMDEFEQTLGDSDGQGSLVCCGSWGCKESDMTEPLNNISQSQPDIQNQTEPQSQSLNNQLDILSFLLPGLSTLEPQCISGQPFLPQVNTFL